MIKFLSVKNPANYFLKFDVEGGKLEMLKSAKEKLETAVFRAQFPKNPHFYEKINELGA